MKIIKTKQIAFNLADPLQKELYDYVNKFNNFSQYGKKLINKDINGDWKNIEEEQNEIDLTNDIINSFL